MRPMRIWKSTPSKGRRTYLGRFDLEEEPPSVCERIEADEYGVLWICFWNSASSGVGGLRRYLVEMEKSIHK